MKPRRRLGRSLNERAAPRPNEGIGVAQDGDRVRIDVGAVVVRATADQAVALADALMLHAVGVTMRAPPDPARSALVDRLVTALGVVRGDVAAAPRDKDG